MSEFLSLFGWIVLLLACGGALTTVVFPVLLWSERRAIKDLVPAEPVEDSSRYEFLLKMNQQAEDLGLIGPDWYRDTTGMLGRVRCVMWRSEDCRVLVLIEKNSSVVPYEKTILLSRLDTTYVLKSTNGDGETDLLGYVESQSKFGEDLIGLYALHLARLDLNGMAPVRMPAVPALLEYEAIERERVQRMVDRGLAVWLFGDTEPWRHTLFGAFLAYLQYIRKGFWKAVGAGLYRAWKDEMAAEKDADMAETSGPDEVKT